MPALHRTLSLSQCIFFGVGSILGAGIYVLIGKVAGHAGNATWLAFLIASVTACLTAFSYAELSAAFPRSGGEYVYVKKAFGQGWGTVLGFTIASNGIISAATVSLGFAGYFAELVEMPIIPVAFGIILLLFGVNAWGVRNSSVVNIVLTCIEILGLVAVVIAAWPKAGTVDLLQGSGQGVNGLFIAAALSFFAYIGFEEIVKLAEEAREPERTIPRALFISNGIVLVIYVGLAALVASAMPWEKLAGSSAPLAMIVESRWGRTGATLLALAALFSTSNTLLSNMLGSSRVLYHMGGELRPLRWLNRVSGRKVPFAALLLVTAVVCAFAAIGDIEQVARITTITIFITFLAVNAAVIALRIKQPKMRRPYRAPMNVRNVPLPSVLGIVFTLVLLGYAISALVSGA
jgi:basic amino acid/polyamine antiporter, APA family